MGKFFKNIFIKAFFLSLIILGLYYAYDFVVKDKKITNIQKTSVTSNITTFPLVNDSEIITTSIALVTKVSQRYAIQTTEKNGQKIRGAGYIGPQQVPESIADIQKEREEYLEKNLLSLKEYNIVLKTDIKKALDNSPNRQKTLESIIDELSYRYKKAIGDKNSLASYASMLSVNANELNKEIEQEKQKLANYFNAYDAENTRNTIETYLGKKNLYQNYYTDITILSQILKAYSKYNDYNKKLLDTLINNKDAIIKESFIVYPDTGNELLKQFDLIYTEQEYKQTEIKNFYEN